MNTPKAEQALSDTAANLIALQSDLPEVRRSLVYQPLVDLARDLTGADATMITLIDDSANRQHFWAVSGMAPDHPDFRGTELEGSFCLRVRDQAAPLVVENAQDEGPDWCGVARRLGVQAYAGWPVISPAFGVLGAVAAINFSPRPWAKDHRAPLDYIASCASDLFALQHWLFEETAGRNSGPNRCWHEV